MAARTRRRRKNQGKGTLAGAQPAWQATVARFGGEITGLLVFAIGGYLGFTIFSSGQASWAAMLAGRMALPLVCSLILTGAVMLLGRHAGYWNPEALVGGELLILSLASLEFISVHAVAGWELSSIGEGGGLIGWGAGNLLIGLLGQLPAALFAALLALLGLILLFRHTPLIYMAAHLALLRHLLGNSMAARSQPPNSDHQEDTLLDSSDLPDRFIPKEPFDQAPPPDEPESSFEEPQPFPMEPGAEAVVAGRSVPAELQMPAAVPARRRSKSANAGQSPLKLARKTGELPQAGLLDDDAGQFEWDIDGMAQVIQQTLQDFDIPVDIVNIESGPTVTQIGVQPLYIERAGQKRKVRVSRIASVADDLALALAAPAIRIEAPVPGQPYVGIEVPNPEKAMVGIKGISQSKQMAKQGGSLPLAIGKDTAGLPVVTDLARAPHLLIAGATGSGKSACINGLIVNLLMYHGPESLRFIMVDPKLVELPVYNRIPHLIGRVITDMEDVHGALTWLLLQMDDRYNLFRELKVRNLSAYNALARRRKKLEPLPYLVLIVDELADLMMTAPEEIEPHLVRLAQMARATGIHLVLATQRPSTDVVTGLIKANFPSRISFAVTSQIDSRVILDSPGAEKLLGQGDMLFMRPDIAKTQRVQGSFVSDAEISRVVDWWQERDRIENPDGPKAKVAPWIGLLDRLDDEEELLADAIDAMRGHKFVNASLVQRALRIGYPRAARLVSLLEKKGVLGPELGGGRRAVLRKSEALTGQEESLFEPL